MKLLVNTVLTDIAGEPLKLGTPEKPENMTLSHVLVQIALQAPPPGGKPYTPEEQIQRYHLALDAHKARETAPYEIQIAAKVVEQLREDISRSYGPIVAGQVLLLLGP